MRPDPASERHFHVNSLLGKLVEGQTIDIRTHHEQAQWERVWLARPSLPTRYPRAIVHARGVGELSHKPHPFPHTSASQATPFSLSEAEYAEKGVACETSEWGVTLI